MRYRVLIGLEIEAQDDRQAHESALKLDGLLRQPIVQMAIEGEGIRLAHGNGNPITHQPQRAR